MRIIITIHHTVFLLLDSISSVNPGQCTFLKRNQVNSYSVTSRSVLYPLITFAFCIIYWKNTTKIDKGKGEYYMKHFRQDLCVWYNQQKDLLESEVHAKTYGL